MSIHFSPRSLEGFKMIVDCYPLGYVGCIESQPWSCVLGRDGLGMLDLRILTPSWDLEAFFVHAFGQTKKY